jgi:hypothetical protein
MRSYHESSGIFRLAGQWHAKYKVALLVHKVVGYSASSTGHASTSRAPLLEILSVLRAIFSPSFKAKANHTNKVSGAVQFSHA